MISVIKRAIASTLTLCLISGSVLPATAGAAAFQNITPRSAVFQEQALQEAVVFGSLQPLLHPALLGRKPVTRYTLGADGPSANVGMWPFMKPVYYRLAGVSPFLGFVIAPAVVETAFILAVDYLLLRGHGHRYRLNAAHAATLATALDVWQASHIIRSKNFFKDIFYTRALKAVKDLNRNLSAWLLHPSLLFINGLTRFLLVVAWHTFAPGPFWLTLATPILLGHVLVNFAGYLRYAFIPHMKDWVRVEGLLTHQLTYEQTGDVQSPARLLRAMSMTVQELDHAHGPAAKHAIEDLSREMRELREWVTLHQAEKGLIPLVVVPGNVRALFFRWSQYQINPEHLPYLSDIDTLTAAFIPIIFEFPARLRREWMGWRAVRLSLDMSRGIPVVPKALVQRTLILGDLIDLLAKPKTSDAELARLLNGMKPLRFEYFLRVAWRKTPWAVLPEPSRHALLEQLRQDTPEARRMKQDVEVLFERMPGIYRTYQSDQTPDATPRALPGPSEAERQADLFQQIFESVRRLNTYPFEAIGPLADLHDQLPRLAAGPAIHWAGIPPDIQGILLRAMRDDYPRTWHDLTALEPVLPILLDRIEDIPPAAFRAWGWRQLNHKLAGDRDKIILPRDLEDLPYSISELVLLLLVPQSLFAAMRFSSEVELLTEWVTAHQTRWGKIPWTVVPKHQRQSLEALFRQGGELADQIEYRLKQLRPVFDFNDSGMTPGPGGDPSDKGPSDFIDSEGQALSDHGSAIEFDSSPEHPSPPPDSIRRIITVGKSLPKIERAADRLGTRSQLNYKQVGAVIGRRPNKNPSFNPLFGRVFYCPKIPLSAALKPPLYSTRPMNAPKIMTQRRPYL